MSPMAMFTSTFLPTEIMVAFLGAMSKMRKVDTELSLQTVKVWKIANEMKLTSRFGSLQSLASPRGTVLGEKADLAGTQSAFA